MEFYDRLLAFDRERADETREERCPVCRGRRHSADYWRKPRGMPGKLDTLFARRFSFCCEKRDCRKRATPESVRFFGRKVFLGVLVTLCVAMIQGFTDSRVARLEAAGISRRTLMRWKEWWSKLPKTEEAFWKAARAKLYPAVKGDSIDRRLIASLLSYFEGDLEDRVFEMLVFLRPLTSRSA